VTLRKLKVHDTWYKIHIDPNGVTANNYSWFGHGIYVYNPGKTTQIFDHLTVDSCDIYNTLRRDISVESTQSIDYTDPTNAKGGQSADPARYNTNLRITNNLIHNTRVDGIYVGGSANFYVAWNTIYNAGSLNDYANTHSPACMSWNITRRTATRTVFSRLSMTRWTISSPGSPA
jgi:parallel beta-helix repeat protein